MHTSDLVSRIAAVVLVIAGVIHLLPSVGVVGAVALHSLYGVDPGDANVMLLLRHRAVLFGVLGVSMILAAFRPKWQLLALAAALVSTVSFVAFWWASTAATPQIVRVAYIDVAVAVLLVAASVLRLRYSAPRA